MHPTLLALAHGLVGRVVPILVALQDPPHAAPSGGGAAVAHPASGAAHDASSQGSPLLSMLPIVLLVGFMLYMMLGPQRKQKQEAEALQKSLQKGDKVVTTSAMIGTITGIDERFVTLEISEKVRVKFLREAISRKLEDPSTVPSTAKLADAKK